MDLGVRSRPLGGWPSYAGVWCSLLSVLSDPAPLVLAVLRKGLVLAAVDIAVSVRRWDARHPLLRARRLLKALVFRLLLSSPMSSSVLVVVVSSLVVQSCLLAGCSTQGCGARRSFSSFSACPLSALLEALLNTLFRL